MVTKEEVKASVEYQWRGQQWKIYMVILAFILIVIFPMCFLETDSLEIIGSVFGIVAAIYGVIFLPFILYAVWRQWELAHRFDHYERHRVKLDQPSSSWGYRGAFLYHVRFQDDAGNPIQLDTKPIFSSGFFSACLLEEYNNKTVEIFYDAEKDRVIVSKLV